MVGKFCASRQVCTSPLPARKMHYTMIERPPEGTLLWTWMVTEPAATIAWHCAVTYSTLWRLNSTIVHQRAPRSL